MEPSIRSPRRIKVSLLLAALMALPAFAHANGGTEHQQTASREPATRTHGGNGTASAATQAAMQAELQRAMERHRLALRPEYERRVRSDGQVSANAWLRAEADRLGRQEAEAIQRRHAGTTAPRANAPGKRQAPRTTAKTADKPCDRIVTRQRVIANLSGGPMQLVMVTECESAAD